MNVGTVNNLTGVIHQDLVGHEVPYILANTNPSSAKFLAFGWESSLINQVVHRFVEQEVAIT
jgi:hypothetical protein